MTNDDLAERLDKIIAILQLVYRGAIDDARETIRRDKVNAAILDASRTWIPAGKLTSTVKSKTSQSGATINRRINELIAIGVLEKQGGGPATAYRSSGLI